MLRGTTDIDPDWVDLIFALPQEKFASSKCHRCDRNFSCRWRRLTNLTHAPIYLFLYLGGKMRSVVFLYLRRSERALAPRSSRENSFSELAVRGLGWSGFDPRHINFFPALIAVVAWTLENELKVVLAFLILWTQWVPTIQQT